MRNLIVGFIGLFGGGLWLVLLVATGFSAFVVGAGLLVALCVMGTTPEDTPHHPGRGSHSH